MLVVGFLFGWFFSLSFNKYIQYISDRGLQTIYDLTKGFAMIIIIVQIRECVDGRGMK